MRSARLAVVLALCLFCLGPASTRDYLSIREFYWTPTGFARGATLDFSIRVANADSRDHWVELFIAIEKVVHYTNGPDCSYGGYAATCANVIDVNEYLELCTDAGMTRYGFTLPAESEVAIRWWSWQTALLACLPPDIQPVAGEYDLTLYVEEWKSLGNGSRRILARDFARKPFHLGDAT